MEVGLPLCACSLDLHPRFAGLRVVGKDYRHLVESLQIEAALTVMSMMVDHLFLEAFRQAAQYARLWCLH